MQTTEEENKPQMNDNKIILNRNECKVWFILLFMLIIYKLFCFQSCFYLVIVYVKQPRQ